MSDLLAGKHVIAELVRHAYLPYCTLGWLTLGETRLATMERPWIKNPQGQGGVLRESCVPDGTYQLRPHHSERFPQTYALIAENLGVYYQQRPAGQAWGRTAILIHQGNWVRDVIGCIAVGMDHSSLSVDPSVIRSKQALDQLRTVLGRDWHELHIKPTAGTT